MSAIHKTLFTLACILCSFVFSSFCNHKTKHRIHPKIVLYSTYKQAKYADDVTRKLARDLRGLKKKFSDFDPDSEQNYLNVLPQTVCNYAYLAIFAVDVIAREKARRFVHRYKKHLKSFYSDELRE